ncbi:MAG: PIN domain-containing protein [Candidatus Nitrosocaldus sp.]
MVCLDTDVIVALLRGDERALEIIDRLQKSNGVLKTTAITVYELIKGASISAINDDTRLVMELL